MNMRRSYQLRKLFLLTNWLSTVPFVYITASFAYTTLADSLFAHKYKIKKKRYVCTYHNCAQIVLYI